MGTTPVSNFSLGQRLNTVLAERPDIPIEACHIGMDAAVRLAGFARERCGAQAFIVCDENTRNAAMQDDGSRKTRSVVGNVDARNHSVQ